jgi:uncharacterized protein DUF6655
LVDLAGSSPLAAKRSNASKLLGAAFIFLLAAACTTIRVTDPPTTADQEFLMTGAAESAVAQLSVEALRGRAVYIDTAWLIPTTQQVSGLGGSLDRQPSLEHLFLIGELRAKLLKSGVRLVSRDRAEVVLEIRSGALSVNRQEFLLGVPATAIPSAATSGLPVTTPDLSLLKSTKQYGWASVAFVAYWANTGELVAVSGPFVGRTAREDIWILGTGPRTLGNIPPAQTQK